MPQVVGAHQSFPISSKEYKGETLPEDCYVLEAMKKLVFIASLLVKKPDVPLHRFDDRCYNKATYSSEDIRIIENGTTGNSSC